VPGFGASPARTIPLGAGCTAAPVAPFLLDGAVSVGYVDHVAARAGYVASGYGDAPAGMAAPFGEAMQAVNVFPDFDAADQSPGHAPCIQVAPYIVLEKSSSD
jgi:hypothetical protein